MRDRSRITIGLALLAGLWLPASPSHAQEDRSGLTRAKYRHNCLMCHSRAAPEGISPEILAGLHAVAGLKPRDAMPNMTCWRRCTTCFPPEPPESAEH